MKTKKGLKEFRRRTKGNSHIVSGDVVDHEVIGCPPCDTVFLRLIRAGKEVLLMCVTPEEALLISSLLTETVAKKV